MKILTSYFYQIRFMTRNMIPLSTCVGDPKWFHKNSYDKSIQFKDKNGVWNGLRAEPFVPGAECDGLCHGRETCNAYGPQTCSFLKAYRRQLDKLDFNEMLARFQHIGTAIQKAEGFTEEPIYVLIVHEAYDNPCSERWVIQDWFKDNNYNIKEFNF